MTRRTPPTILFMGRIFEIPWGGVREVAESLLRAAAPLCEADGRRIDVLVPRAGLTPVRSPAVREVVLPRFGSNRILWDHHTVRRHANGRRNAVLYNVKLVLPEGLRLPGFVSIHDLMYFPQPGKYDWREYLLGDTLYMRLMISRTVRRAPLVHCDSTHTANDARELFPDVPPSRFRTILLGVDQARFSPGEPLPGDEGEWRDLLDHGLRTPYVLHTGGLSRRKNVSTLARAFRPFVRRHPEYQLVLTGGSKPTLADPALQPSLDRLPPESHVRLGQVTDRQLALLYQRAAYHVFPSLYEGFGLPPLEAMAAGCPSVCSNASSLPEVVADAALLFDPRDPRQLLRHMESLTDAETRQALRVRGLARAAEMTWESTARQWLALADEVHARGRRRR
jgi:glycosyltransferase involved in cell wall biosynthesis